MASPVSGNAFQTYQSIGNREDLEDEIYMISPVETPFMTMAARTTAKAVYHEWQTDALAAAGTNQAIEGDDAANGTATPTVRMGNWCQISTKYAVVTDTQNAIDKAGRGNEMSYQVAKKLQELKRDMEFALVTNQGATAGGAASVRSSAGVEAFLVRGPNQTAATVGNSTSVGQTAEGTTPGFKTGGFAGPTDASTGGTFAVAQLKNVIASCWENGGNPGIIMCAAAVKQKISGFSGIATLYREAGSTAKGTAIVGAADLYISDFGEHRVVPNRFVRKYTGLNANGVCLVLDMDYWSVAYLRKVSQKPLARTGASERRFIDVEFGLVAKNPLASGKIADINPNL